MKFLIYLFLLLTHNYNYNCVTTQIKNKNIQNEKINNGLKLRSSENKKEILKTVPLKIIENTGSNKLNKSEKEGDMEENTHRRVNSEASTTSKFQDVINEVRTIKIELFGNPEESMDFFKRNKSVYESKMIQRMTKIAKIIELEELLEFYDSSSKKNSQNKKQQ